MLNAKHPQDACIPVAQGERAECQNKQWRIDRKIGPKKGNRGHHVHDMRKGAIRGRRIIFDNIQEVVCQGEL
jgi:hypothetical protein